MTFAVVIPAFENEATVADAVTSALSQVGVEEVVVVDDGSSDGTAAAAGSVDDERIRVVSQSNQGPSAARNTGVRKASAPYVVMLDADDRLLPGALVELGRAHQGGADLVRAGAVYRDENGSERPYLARADPHPFPRGAALAGSFSMARALFEAIGGYDELLACDENTELVLRAQLALMNSDGTIGFLDQPTALVQRHSTRTADHYRQRRLDAIERILKVHQVALEADRATHHTYHAIAATLYGREGRKSDSVRHARLAARVRPGSVRSWARLARSLVQ